MSASSQFQSGSAIVRSDSLLAGIEQAFETAAAGIRQPIALIFVFFRSEQAPSDAEKIAEYLSRAAPGAIIVGCSSDSVLGQRFEYEQVPAVSVLMLAGLGATPQHFHIEFQPTAEGPSIFGLPDELLEGPSAGSGMIVLADPFSFPIDLLFQRVAEEAPGLPVLGGYSSGVSGLGDCGLILNEHSHCRGAVGILLPHELEVVPLVSQGCRPIGQRMIVTRCDDNLLLSLSGKPALQQLRRLFEESPNRDQRAMLRSLLLGRAFHEYQGPFEHGDFLVRQCLGVDDTHDAVVLSEPLRVGQTVQFHVRDSETADADLQAILRQTIDRHGIPAAALMFSCNGRGTQLFEQHHHDAALFDRYCPGLPLAGIFAAGEFGPVGKLNFLHSFTATAAMFYPKR